ncbi:hypothetical protein Rhopal_004500-T1 [Rhodotorula paludigena]|uniref:F-box domain-containing protein n=1 Tax=Rhodotorula paludigena TaxID=86838 RepID=A0AAV5GR25_9BASI|nr:hypothetical protein Rhopal_004500-T1 [Rhodotorula paludigena]
MSASPPLSPLEQLPIELLTAILAHIPPRTHSHRPLASIANLARSSRHLYATLAPLVHSHVRFTTPDHVGAFVDHVPPSRKQHIRTLEVVQSPVPLALAALEPVLHSLDALTELRLGGVEGDPLAVLNALARSGVTRTVERLELDFGLSSRSSAAEASRRTRTRTKDAALPWSDRLRELSLRTLPASAPASSEGPGSSIGSSSLRLRKLELEAVALDDVALDDLLASTSATLEHLSLRECTTFTRHGLASAIKAHGGRIRHLVLAAPPPSSPRSPPSSPPRSPSLQPASSPPLLSALPSLVHIADDLLPHLPQLTTLSLSSDALLSPAGLAALSTTTPYLRSIRLTGFSPRALVPLVQRAHPSRLVLCAAAADEEELHDEADVAELWSAALAADVELEGPAFEGARERMEWARKEAEKVATATAAGAASAGRRRKRPSTTL